MNRQLLSDHPTVGGDNVADHPFLQFNGLANGSWFIFFVIAVASSRLGRVFTHFGLPLITGYMIIGCLCGPYVLNMVTLEQTPDLAYVTQIALSFIAFSAGSELYLPELRSLFRVIALITGFNALFTYVLCSLFIYMLAQTGVIPWMSHFPSGCSFTISLIAGSIMVARSPASAIAVVRELRAKGPVTSTMLGVTVVGDVVVLILFTLSNSFALAQCNGGGFAGGEFLITIITLIFAVGIGYALGGLLIFLLWIPRVPARFTIIPIGFLTFVLCDWFAVYSVEKYGVSINFDALLVCITAGYVVTNQSRNRAAFLHVLGSSASYIFIPFFTKVGVELNLRVFIQMLGFAALVFLMRAFCVFCGSFTGARIAGMDRFKQLTLWCTMLAQAGVSLGLASEVRVKFPEWGPYFQTSIIAVVLINQFVGPIACKWALRKHNEAGKMLEGEDAHGESHGHSSDHAAGSGSVEKPRIKRTVIVGVDSASLAVAQRMLHAGYAVTMLDSDATKLSLTKLLVIDKPDITGKAVVSAGVAGKESESAGDSNNNAAVASEPLVTSDEESKSTTAAAEVSVTIAESSSPSVSSAVSTALVSEARLLSIRIPEITPTDLAAKRTLPVIINGLINWNSTVTVIESALTFCANDEETYAVSSYLLDSHHLTSVCARLYNPAWSAEFTAHGIIPYYSLSVDAHIIMKSLTTRSPVFVSDVLSMPSALSSMIDSELDLSLSFATMSAGDAKEFERKYSAPSVDTMNRLKLATEALLKVKVTTVAHSEREEYMERLLATHNDEHTFDESSEHEDSMILGVLGQAEQNKRNKSKVVATINEAEESVGGLGTGTAGGSVHDQV